MPPSDRMFQVIVLGGIVLVGPAACGGSVETPSNDAGERVDAFPQETAQVVDARAPVGDAHAEPDGFPQETGARTDGGGIADAAADRTCIFPQETDSTWPDACVPETPDAFPQETASP
jgi:hypothetical protein